MNSSSSTLSYRVDHATPIDTAPVIDAQALLTRCMGDVSFACLLLDELETSGLTHLNKIRQQARQQNATGIAEAAHALKGAAGIMCAESVAKLAAEIEQAGRAAELGDGIEAMIRDLSDEMQRCLDGLPQLREEMQLVKPEGRS